MSHARYIGDAVYAQFDGNGILLTTGSHYPMSASNQIVLEPEILEAFQRYVTDLKSRLESDPLGTPEQI